MALKREIVCTRKRGKKNDSLHSLNSSKTDGQNPQGNASKRENSPVLNVASNFQGKEQGF